MDEQKDARSRTGEKRSNAADLHAQTRTILDEPGYAQHTACFAPLKQRGTRCWANTSFPSNRAITVKASYANGFRTQSIRRTRRFRASEKRSSTPCASYCTAFPLDTQEVDVAVEAADEFRSMLDKLRADDLPRFEARFKELLNENTIREVANFQSQLARERETIKERIARINESLTKIDYNAGRYIVLEAQATPNADIRDFQTELRSCTEGALTGSDDVQYSETKFLAGQTDHRALSRT